MVVFVRSMDDEGRRKRGGFFRRFFNGGSWSLSSDSRHQSSYSIAVNTPPTERRPLRSVPTLGPGHRVNPDILAKSFVEKEMKYLGTVNDISNEFDANNRNSLLSLVDEKRRLAQFPNKLGYRNDVLCSFSIHNLKISWRDGEYVIHRIPTHKISSVGFVQDDLYYYVFVRFASELGDSASCLGVFSTETRVLAEEFCSLTQQMFELVYTETTMDFFDKSIQDGADTPKNHSYSTDDSGGGKTQVNTQVGSTETTMTLSKRLHLNIQRFLPEFARQSSGRESNSTIIDKKDVSPPLGGAVGNHGDQQDRCHNNSSAPASINGATPIVIKSPPPRQHSSDVISIVTSPTSSTSTPTIRNRFRSESDSVAAGGGASQPGRDNVKLPDVDRLRNMDLQDFISLLRECLDNDELSEFAHHLHHFRTGGLTIKSFLLEVIKIYTDKRKTLLLGMRNFIPSDNDRLYFDEFLKQHQIIVPPCTSSTTVSTSSKSGGDFSNLSEQSKEGEGSSNSLNIGADLTELSSSALEEEDDVTTTDDVMTDDAASTVKRHSSSHVDDDVIKSSQDNLDDPMDESQCILRSGDVTEDETTTLGCPTATTTTVEMSQLKLQLNDRCSTAGAAGGRKSRGSDLRRSPTPEELGAPFPSFVSYATAATSDATNEAPLSGHNTSSSGGKSSQKKKKKKMVGQQLPTSTSGNNNTTTRTPPRGSHGDDTTVAMTTDNNAPPTPQHKQKLRHPAEHRKKKKHKHHKVSKHHQVVGIVTEL